MDSPITDSLAQEVIQHRPGALARLIDHARALESAARRNEGATDTDAEPLSTAQEAEQLINGARRDAYGPVSESFEVVARLWAPILGLAYVSPRKVAACMLALKMARELTGSTQHDNFTDMVGYALLWEQIQQEDTP